MEPGERGEFSYETTANGDVRAVQYYRDHLRKRRRGTGVGSTKAAARRAATRNIDEALAARRSGYELGATLAVAVEDWLRSVKTLVEQGTRSPTTYDQYAWAARKYVIPGVGHLRLTEATTGRLDAFLVGLRDTKGYATTKAARAVLNGTCGMLVRRDALPANPVRDVSKIEQSRRKATRALTEDEVRKFLEGLDASDFAQRRDLPDLVRFLLATGVRIGEALALRWSDVDLDAGLVVVEWTMVRVRGRGLIRKEVKTSTSERTLVLPRWCVAMLLARRGKASDDAPVFPSAVGTFRDRDNVSADLRVIRKELGFDWVKWHTARRTVATVLDGRGMSARAIADQLGHARPSMTQDVYMGRKVTGVGVSPLEDLLSPKRADEAGDAA